MLSKEKYHMPIDVTHAVCTDVSLV